MVRRSTDQEPDENDRSEAEKNMPKRLESGVPLTMLHP
jgi:hypothetical protein